MGGTALRIKDFSFVSGVRQPIPSPTSVTSSHLFSSVLPSRDLRSRSLGRGELAVLVMSAVFRAPNSP